MNLVLITGANGFVGSALCSTLAAAGVNVRRALRRLDETQPALPGESCAVGQIGGSTDWRSALSGVDTIVHLAARVHVMTDTAADPLQAFRTVNRDGTMRLAKMAVDAGVKRLVYLSSIKVNGEATDAQPFTEADMIVPNDPYARSKWEAEQELLHLASVSDLEVVIIRPPLVYGPGVKANFLKLMNITRQRIPLPLAGIHNRRSLIALDNLLDFIICCLNHPKAANEVFVISDGEDLSTPELIRRLASAMRTKARLFPLPPGALKMAAAILGRRAMMKRLAGSLHVDATKARCMLGWKPPLTVEQGLHITVESFLATSS